MSHNQGAPTIPHVRPETPRTLTHTHDEDCSEDSSEDGANEEVTDKV